jgi:hypothetical protein
VASNPQSTKKKRHFRLSKDAEKWCEIYRTTGNNLEECKTFLDRKKMPAPLAPVPQEPWRVDQRRTDSDRDE